MLVRFFWDSEDVVVEDSEVEDVVVDDSEDVVVDDAKMVEFSKKTAARFSAFCRIVVVVASEVGDSDEDSEVILNSGAVEFSSRIRASSSSSPSNLNNPSSSSVVADSDEVDVGDSEAVVVEDSEDVFVGDSDEVVEGPGVVERSSQSWVMLPSKMSRILKG